jgi:hypothetical protein
MDEQTIYPIMKVMGQGTNYHVMKLVHDNKLNNQSSCDGTSVRLWMVKLAILC